jgi:ribulose-phosphate 3-epimerase|tara:strand:- start:455 stop:1105 length:651 start_codon:yes stop_codon:yes gene_type:complete
MNTIISPSILAADFGNLQSEIEMINKSEADWFHIDIMDGLFVPNISFGMPVLKAIKNYASKPLDVHLMIIDPERYIKNFYELNASLITIHFEATSKLRETIKKIKSFGIKTGVAINPETPVNVLEKIINEVDLVCLMSVNPGFGGQNFIDKTFVKLFELKNLIKSKKSNSLIQVDGGVTDLQSRKLIELGADVLVAGNFIFKSKTPNKIIKKLREF